MHIGEILACLFVTFSVIFFSCIMVKNSQCVLCDIQDSGSISFILQLANAHALKNDVYQAGNALKVVDTLIDKLENGISYSDFYVMLAEDVDPVTFIVIDEYTDRWSRLDKAIAPEDEEILIHHLRKQRNIIKMFMDK